MGKSRKLREERRVQREEQQRLAQKKQKRNRVVVAIVALVAVLVLVPTTVFTVMSKTGWLRRRGISMETPNFKITDQMMAYYIYSSYQSEKQQYGDALNLDENKSLKKQYFREDASWFDYYDLQARTNLRQILLFAEKAREQNVTLTEAELADIAAYVEQTDISIYRDKFACNADDFRKAHELTALASKMYQQMMQEVTVTDRDIDDFYEKNANYFKTIDYRVLSFPYGENGWFADAAGAKAAANFVEKAKTEEEYDEFARQILLTIGATEENVKTELQDAEQTGAVFLDGNEFFTWAFDAARKPLETYVEDTGSAYRVYQLLTLPKRDETTKPGVRHILLTADTYGSADKAKQKAEELLAQWKRGDATEASFGELATAHTEDESSRESGGLYENLSQGETVEKFDAWCFDESRKAGDTGIVETEYGYHVMYFVGDGQPQWRQSVKTAILSEKTDELCAEYAEIWTVEVHENHIRRLPL